MDVITLLEELRGMRAERKMLRAACAKSLLACQDNLKMFQYKNEPLLHEAMLMCRDALGDEGMRLQREGNPCSADG